MGEESSKVQRESRALIDSLLRDLRQSFRITRRRPGFVIAVGLTLGLGTGVSAALFEIVDRVFIRAPRHVDMAEPLYQLHLLEDDNAGRASRRPRLAYPEYRLLEAVEPRSYDAAAYAKPVERKAVVEGTARVARVAGVSDGFFDVLGVGQRWGGRGAGKDTRSGVVVREGFAPLGTIVIAGRAHDVVGVVPDDFTGVDIEPTDVWMPLVVRDGVARETNQTWYDLKVVLRARNGATAARIAPEIARALELKETRPALASLQAARAADMGGSMRLLILLSAVGMAVMLLGCVSAANLLLVRFVGRLRELGVRMALGMDRAALAGLLAGDCAVLMLFGCLAALVTAWLGGSFARALLLPGIAANARLVDGRTVWFVLGSMTIVTIAIVAALASQVGRLRPLDVLADRVLGTRLPASAAFRMLTATQTMVAFVMLVCTALFFRSLQKARAVDVGVDPRGVAYVHMQFDSSGYSRADGFALANQMRERVAELPWVQSSSLAAGLPLTTYNMVPVRVPGSVIPATAGGGPNINAVHQDYFATVGTRIVSGRSFGSDDAQGAEGVAIVNETMARLVWPDGEAMGRCILVGPMPLRCHRVVGVAQDAHTFGLKEERAMQYYVPAAQRPDLMANPYLVARARPGQDVPVAEVQALIATMAPALRTNGIGLMEQRLSRLTRQWRESSQVLVVLGIVALVVALAGVYGVVALAVVHRERECCIRLALGATQWSVLTLILRAEIVNTVVAIALGALVVAAGAKPLGPLLFDVSPLDLVSYVVAGGIVVLSTMVAAAGPSWRAARMPPARVTAM